MMMMLLLLLLLGGGDADALGDGDVGEVNIHSPSLSPFKLD